MKRMLLLLALLPAAPAAVSAPAPVYKERPSLETAHRALPEELRDEIELSRRSLPAMIEDKKRDLRLARTQKERQGRLAGIEHCKAQYYIYPISYLKYQRKQPKYHSREDQARIETALKYYRLGYEEAKKKGLVNASPDAESEK